jgi:S1-C subfamily serine protease
LILFKINKRDYDPAFVPAKLSQGVNLGDQAVVLGKSPQNFNLIETGLVNETHFNTQLSFGKDFDTSSFNYMVNI